LRVAPHHVLSPLLLHYSSEPTYSPNSSIKVATFSHTPSQILSNISKAVPAIAAHIPGGWDNIQSLYIKTNTSVSLPIWSCNLDERWSELVKGEDEKDKEVEAAEKKKGKKKEQVSKKRPVEDESKGSEEEEQPRKKVKSGKAAPVAPTVAKPLTKPKKTQPTGASSTDQKTAKSGAPTPSETQKKQKKVHPDPEAAHSKSKAKPQLTLSSEGKGLSKTELKQKRSGITLEKKKEKIVGAKAGLNGKSAKAKMLGQRALQS
jgi:ribosome biogenesis protein UTP30